MTVAGAMRILVDTSAANDERSGAARRFLDILPATAAAHPDCSWTVVATAGFAPVIAAALPAATIEIFPTTAHAGWAARRRHNARLAALAGRGGFDLVLQDTLPPALPSRTWPTIHDLRFLEAESGAGLPRRLYGRHLLPRRLRACPKLIAVSGFMADRIAHELRYPRERIVLLPNGIDVDAFRARIGDVARVARLGLSPRSYLLAVGHREPRKNFEVLIRAQEQIVRRGHALPLVIVGRSARGYREPERLVRELALEKHVRFFDAVDSEILPALYAAASVYLAPSIHEGFGITILEALAAGVAVLAADVESNRNLFPSLPRVPCDDPSAWAAAIGGILAGGCRPHAEAAAVLAAYPIRPLPLPDDR